jgi:hypothetical protein
MTTDLDRFSQGPDDPQDSAKEERWVGTVTTTYTAKIARDDNCYSKKDAEEEAQRRINEGISDPRYECDGDIVKLRET